MNKEIQQTIWDRLEKPLTDPILPETSDGLATFYVSNYIQAIQALHNMKQAIYKTVDKYELTDNIQHRLLQLLKMTEEDYHIYHTADFIIKSGDNLIESLTNLKVMTEIRKKLANQENPIEYFNNLPVMERNQILMQIQHSITNTI